MRTTELPIKTASQIDEDDKLIINVDGVTSQITLKELIDKLNAVEYFTDTGGDDAYIITTGLSLSALIAGMKFVIKPTTANTGACTLTVDNVAAKNIKVIDAAGTRDPLTSEIVAGMCAQLLYDGTNFILLNPSSGTDIIIGANSDIQTILNTHTARSVTLRFKETIPQNTTITLGNSTKIIGENPNLTEQSGKTFYPRGVLDFSSSAITGIQTDSASHYRCQKINLEKFVIKGSGYNNGKEAIKLINNALHGHPGLFTTRELYIENYEIGIDENSIGDSSDHRDVHIHKFNIGIKNLHQNSVIDHLDLWWAAGASPIGILIEGNTNIITRCEFALGDAGIGTPEVALDSIHIKINATTGYLNIISNCGFYFGCTRYIDSQGYNNVFIGNFFCNFDGIIANVVKLGLHESFVNNVINLNGASSITSDGIVSNSGHCLIAGNIIRRYQRADDVIYLNSSNNTVAYNVFDNCGGANSNVYVNTGAADNILIGEFPQGVIDNGIRTIINGVSKNNGNPATTGNWFGYASLAAKHGVVIENIATNPSEFYKADSQGNWVKISP